MTLASAGCGGGGSPPAAAASATKASTTTTSTSDAAFRACLKSHGVTLPAFRGGNGGGAAPNGAGGGPTGASGGRPTGATGADGSTPPARPQRSAAQQQAFQACAKLAPNRGGAFGGNRAAFDAYRSCLQDHGVTADASTDPRSLRADPSFAAADATCAALRPTPRAAPTTTSTTAG